LRPYTQIHIPVKKEKKKRKKATQEDESMVPLNLFETKTQIKNIKN